MDYGWDFLWTVAASSAGTSLLLGAAAFLGRGQISHWLAKDLEKIKASHQRDLEAYKVSLIAETERVKAEQDIKKSAALKFLEKKFAALDRFHRAMAGIRFQVAAASTLDANQKLPATWEAISARMKELIVAENELDIFCSQVERQAIFGLRLGLNPFMEHCVPGSPSLSQEQVNHMLAATKIASDKTEALIQEMIKKMGLANL